MRSVVGRYLIAFNVLLSLSASGIALSDEIPGVVEETPGDFLEPDMPVIGDNNPEDHSEDLNPFDFDNENPADHNSGADMNRDHQCYRANGNPRFCAEIHGCRYDYRFNTCRPHGGGGAPQFCQNYNYKYRQCVAAGCQFDGRTGICFGGGNPQPYPPQPYPPQPYPPHGHGFVCVAVDAGWEEHGGGHRGMGRNQYEAQQAALGDCMRFHGRCRVTQCRQTGGF